MGLGRENPINLKRKLEFQTEFSDVSDEKKKQLMEKISQLEMEITERKSQQALFCAEKEKKKRKKDKVSKKKESTEKQADSGLSALSDSTGDLSSQIDEIDLEKDVVGMESDGSRSDSEERACDIMII